MGKSAVGTSHRGVGLVERLITPRDFRMPRVWSNRELRRVAPHFGGEVINVSAWEDGDKEGGHYRDYFTSATRYYTSNYGGVAGESELTDFHVDLEQPLAPELRQRFDVVFNHTTLEHVFDVFTAVRNMCEMSRDVVLVVVPFLQRVHTEATFSDYWRFTHHGLVKLFEKQGFDVAYLSSTPYRGTAVYHLCVAARNAPAHREKLAHLHGHVNEGWEIGRDTLVHRAARAAYRRLGSVLSSRRERSPGRRPT